MGKYQVGDIVAVTSERLRRSWTFLRFFRVAAVDTYDLHGSDEGERAEWDQPVYLSAHYIPGGRKPELGDGSGGCYLHPDDVGLIEAACTQQPSTPQQPGQEEA